MILRAWDGTGSDLGRAVRGILNSPQYFQLSPEAQHILETAPSSSYELQHFVLRHMIDQRFVEFPLSSQKLDDRRAQLNGDLGELKDELRRLDRRLLGLTPEPNLQLAA